MKNPLTFLNTILLTLLLALPANADGFTPREVEYDYVETTYAANGKGVAWFDVTSDMCMTRDDMFAATADSANKVGPLSDPDLGRFAMVFYVATPEEGGYAYGEVWTETEDLHWCFAKFTVRDDFLPEDFEHNGDTVEPTGEKL